MSPEDIIIREALFPDDLTEARRLFEAYWRWREDVSRSAAEAIPDLGLAGGRFAPPRGGLLVAEADEVILGAAGFCPLAEGCCELALLFVDMSARAYGIGRDLLVNAIFDAEEAGYREMRTIASEAAHPALTLFHSVGFRAVEPFGGLDPRGLVFLQCRLA